MSNKIQKLLAKNQQNHSTVSKDIGDLLFKRTLAMLDHTQLKRHDNNLASMDVQLHTTNKQNNATTPRDIVILENVGHAQACLTKLNNQQLLHELTKASTDI